MTRRIQQVLLLLTLLAASAMPAAVTAQITTPDQLVFQLRGASTQEERDKAMDAARRGQERYADEIRTLEEQLDMSDAYLLRSGSGELVAASHKEIGDLAAQVELELMLDPTNERINHLRGNASGSSQVDLAVRIALDQTVQAVNIGMGDGREMPDGETIGKVTGETMVAMIVEFDRQNREALQKDLDILKTDLERLNEMVAREDGTDLAGEGDEATGTADTDGPASGSPSEPASGTYMGEATASLLMTKKPTRWETPVYFTINPDGTGSISLNFFVKSEYAVDGGGRVACLLGGGRVDDFAIGSAGGFSATVPAQIGYRDSPSSSVDPCIEIEADRAGGDFGDEFPVAIGGTVDPASGTAELTLGWFTGPIEVKLKRQ